MAYNYTGAFVGYFGGAPVEELAEEFHIPLKSLQAKIRQEGWRALANRIAPRFGPDTSPADGILDKIEANRAKNFEGAAKLREHAMEIIDALRTGTLRIKKQFQHKGQIIEFEAEPSPVDCLNIVTYFRTITEMTYRALGDHEANGRYTGIGFLLISRHLARKRATFPAVAFLFAGVLVLLCLALLSLEATFNIRGAIQRVAEVVQFTGVFFVCYLLSKVNMPNIMLNSTPTAP